MFSASQVFVALFSILAIRYFYQLIRNYVVASRSGLPLIILPFDQNNIVWIIVSAIYRPWMRQNFPALIYDRLKYGIYGWEFQEKLKPFHTVNRSPESKDLGDRAFFLCGMGRLELWTASSTLAYQIALHPDDFQQPSITQSFLNIFGVNVFSSNGKVWARHRRIVASAVTERISPVVWSASVAQTHAVLGELCAGADGERGETVRFFDMLKTVTINVLSKAGMGVEKDWATSADSGVGDDNDTELSYMDSIKMVNEYMGGPVILPAKVLLRIPSWIPGYRSFRRLGRAKIVFPIRTKELVATEKQRLAEGNSLDSKNNLLSSLVAASNMGDDGYDTEKQSSKTKAPALTDDELTGNLFIFTAAGYDTTAGTLTYAITMLMRYPEWQDWLFEEVDAFMERRPTGLAGDNAEYQAFFPSCTRLLAVMFETLRLFPPIIHLIKENMHPVTLTTDSGKIIAIPANTTTYVNTVSLHLDHKLWRNLNLTSDESDKWEDEMPGRDGAIAADYKLGGGKLGDEWRFRPTRWIQADVNTTQHDRKETLFQPPKGSFLPWSVGPRMCPGYRMAQVEFVAILLTILSNYRVEAVAANGESRTALNERLDRTVQRSFSKLALEMDVFNKMDTDDEVSQSSNGIKVRLMKRKP